MTNSPQSSSNTPQSALNYKLHSLFHTLMAGIEVLGISVLAEDIFFLYFVSFHFNLRSVDQVIT